MVEHTLQTVHESLVQGYCATVDSATGDCARLHDKRYYCTLGKEKNTTRCAHNNHHKSCVDLRDTFEDADDVCISAIHIGANINHLYRYSPGI